MSPAVHAEQAPASATGRTDPFHVVGFWHGCLYAPDQSIGAESYWAGYAKAMRKVHGRERSEALSLEIDVLRHFGRVNAAGIVKQYMAQRRKAAQRGIDWQFDVVSWLSLWLASGKWLQRGRGRYVMARHGDVGPYSPDNVSITTQAENSREWLTVRASRAANLREASF